MRCAIAHGNASKKWGRAIPLLDEARALANDKKVVEQIDLNLSTARENDRLFNKLQPVDSAPTLRTINGFGFAIYGKDDFDATSGSHMATYYFAALFFPLFPIARYRVIPTGNGYRFLGKGSFAANAVRLQLHTLAYNLANFMRTLALPETVAQWSLTSLRDKLVKIGAKVVRHARYAIFQMAEVAVPRELFEQILRLIDGLRPRPAPA
jgi:hypothetical protein